MKKSIDEMVQHWDDVFQATSKVPKKDAIALYVKLIQEEAKETLHAWEDSDTTEIIDGAGDVIWVAVKLLQIMGYQGRDIIELIHESNMSKLSNLPRYSDLLYSEPVELEGKTMYVIRRRSDGKIMKSDNFKKPEI